MLKRKIQPEKNNGSNNILSAAYVIDEHPILIDASAINKDMCSEEFRHFADEAEKHWKGAFSRESDLKEKISKTEDKKQETIVKLLDRVGDPLWDMRAAHIKDLSIQEKAITKAEEQADVLWMQMENWLLTSGYKRIDCLGKAFDSKLHQSVNEAENQNSVVEAEIRPGFWDSNNNHLVRASIVRLRQTKEGDGR